MSQAKPEDDKFQRGMSFRQTPSLFGPIVLIALGVGFLLANLGLLPAVNWTLLLRLWPVMLILWGVNLLVRQAPRPFGTWLSALVGLIAVGGVAYVLFWGSALPWVQKLNAAGEVVRNQAIEFAPEGVTAADIEIGFSQVSAEFTALPADDPNLIHGTITYIGDLIFETNQAGANADVNLDTQSQEWWFLNPANWTTFSAQDKWQLGVQRDVALDLTLDGGSGSLFVDLVGLSVRRLSLNGGSGSVTLMLADGDYNVELDGGSGSVNLSLPARGRPDVQLQGGSGSITVRVPSTMAARVVVQPGSGGFSAGGRFERVEQSGDEETWETTDYATATNRTLLTVDGDSGSLTLAAP